MFLLSSVSHFSKVIKPKEGLLELPIYSQQIRSTGDCQDLWAAAEVGLGKSYRTGDRALNLWDLELRCYDAPHVVSALPCNVAQPAGTGELLGVGTLHTHTSNWCENPYTAFSHCTQAVTFTGIKLRTMSSLMSVGSEWCPPFSFLILAFYLFPLS